MEAQPTQALATVPSTLSLATLRPSSLDEAMRLAERLAGCEILPPELRKPSSLLLMILKADDLGLSVAQAIDGIHVIKGRVTMSAALMMGVCLRRPSVCTYFRVVEDLPGRVTYETQRAGGVPQRASFTLDEARAAQLDKSNSNWQKWPNDMMHARARARLARRVYPDVLLGMASREEVEDGAIDMVETDAGRFSAPPVPVPSGAHRDVKPSNVAEHASAPPAGTVIEATAEPVSLDRAAFLKLIGAARSVAALESLVDGIRKLPDDDRNALLPPYRAAKELLMRAAAAPAATPTPSTFRDAPAPTGNTAPAEKRTWGDEEPEPDYKHERGAAGGAPPSDPDAREPGSDDE